MTGSHVNKFLYREVDELIYPSSTSDELRCNSQTETYDLWPVSLVRSWNTQRYFMCQIKRITEIFRKSNSKETFTVKSGIEKLASSF